MLIGSRGAGPFAMPAIIGTPPIWGGPDEGALPGGIAAPAPAAPAAEPAKTGVFDRIGAFLKSDQGRAALLRSAAATLQGGLGAGIEAGAGYIDGQKAMAAKQHQQDFENGLATRGADLAELRQQQGNDLGWAGVDVNLRQLGETTRSNKARENLTMRGQNVDMRGQDVSRANNTDNNLTSRANNAEDNATSRANNQATVGASIYGTNLDYLASGQRAAAGIGSKGAPYMETRTETPAVDATNPWFGAATPAQPKTTTIMRTPLAPAGAAPQAAIDALKANPNLRGQFEAKYGAGSASQYLGGR